MRNLFRQSWGIAIVLAVAACGGDDESGTNESAETAGSGASGAATAGKTGSNGGSKSTPRGGSGGMKSAAGGSTGSTTTPRGGSSGSTQPSTGGKGGAGGKLAQASDDDAGVPAAGGHGGTGGHGGNGGSGGAASEAGSGGAGGSTASAATFTEVYALMSAGCAGAACHVNATTPGGMLAMPDKATAYKNLVNADATQCAGEKRVVPNDPAKSELVATLKHIKVGSCARTPRMPDNMPQWKESDIAVVASWVEAGAQDN